MATEEKRSTDLSDNDEDSGNDEPPYTNARDVGAMFAVNRIRPNGDNDGDGDDDGDGDGGGPANANEQNADAFDRRPPANPNNAAGDGNDPNHMQVPLAPMRRNSNDRIAIYENAFLGDRPDPQPPRNLRQYLCALTENHENAMRPVVNENVVNDQASTSAAKPTNTIGALPVEVLLVIFSYLDDISLCHVGEVCKQWKNILEVHTPQSLWQRYTKTRWPLYSQITHTTNWLKVPILDLLYYLKVTEIFNLDFCCSDFQIYSSLMNSCFCRTCVVQMTLRTPQQQENHFRARRLRGDIRTLTADATEGIEAVPLDNSLSHWQASIVGPPNSPYEGGKFFLHILIPFS